MPELHLTGSDLTASAFQAAIDRLSTDGEGTIVLPPGEWDTGEIALRPGITLQLPARCTLRAHLIAESVRDISVLGEGPDSSVVTGGLRLKQVENVICRGWSGRVIAGEHVSDGRFTGLKLHQPPQRHGGGSVVWFLWSHRLHWEDCDLESNDDVFCLKRECTNITLTRSRLRGRMAAPFKIGTESDGTFRDIVFADSVIERSDRAALSIEAVDGANISNVRIERIRMEDINAPIFIRLGNRDRFSRGPGSIRGVLIADITGYGREMDEGFGSCISGLPGRPVEDITLRNIRFESLGGQPESLLHRAVPERPELYPEFDMFGRLPAHGLYARHVRGLRLEQCSWTVARPDGRPAIVAEDASGVQAVGTPAPYVRTAVAPPAVPALPAGDVAALFRAIAAATPGQAVVVEPGDYAIPREKGALVLDKPGLVLKSARGPEHTRIRMVGAKEHPRQYRAIVEPALAREFDVLVRITANGVRLSGFTLSAGVYNVFLDSAADCEISGNAFDFSKCYHVDAYRCRNLLLTGNHSRAALTCSIKLDLCEDCVIRDNIFEEDPAGVSMVGSCGSTVSGNRFLGVSWHGVTLSDQSHRNRITGNLFADGRLTGLQLRASSGNEVTGNEFRGNKTESVLVDQDSRDNRIRDNSFHDNRGMAVSNETPHAVDAAGNWWGSPEGPRPGVDADHRVTVRPWLTSPPPPLSFPEPSNR